jgi:arylsulfatase A-like enzyme
MPPKPFFAYVHFMPPHNPYIGPPAMKHFFADEQPPGTWEAPFPFEEIEPELRASVKGRSQSRYVNLYDGNLRYGDWAVGEVERLLREAGVFEDTILIVTSDHGEAFGEHGYWGHTFSAFDESIHVPLVVRLPGSERVVGRVSGLTQTVDLLPTLFDMLEISYPREAVQGRSLLPLLSGEAEEVNEYVFARAAGQPPSYVVRDHSSLLLLYEGGKLRALYDLERDPRAVSNVIDRERERARRLTEAFREFAEGQAAPPLNFVDPNAPPPTLPEANEVQMTDEMRRSLKALGYLR